MRQFDRYQVKRRDNLGDPAFWNVRFEDLDNRLHARELDGDRIDRAVDDLIAVALQRLNDTFTPVVQQAIEQLESVGARFEAESLTENEIGLGEMTFVITPETRAAWVVTDYVAISAIDDPENGLIAGVVSYDRTTGILIVDATGAIGDGLFDAWKIRVSAPPDLEHATRTDNPHMTTAAQVGAYTTAQTDAAIAAALAGYAPPHPAIADVTGLSAALAAKADTSAVTLALAAKADTGHGHAQSDVTGLVSALAAKANASGVRERLTGPRTYFVRPDGNDANNGLSNSAVGAFATMQKAYDVVVSTLDLAGNDVTIKLADGTYTTQLRINYGWMGGGNVIVDGNSSAPGNVIISTTSADCFFNLGALPALLKIKNLKMQTTTSGACIHNSGLGDIHFDNVIFGTVPNAAAHLSSDCFVGRILSVGAYTIAGNAGTHITCVQGAVIINPATVTLTGTPNFAVFFAYASRQSFIQIWSVTFSGSATGTRHYAEGNSLIFTGTGNTNNFPGNVAGSENSGSRVV